MNPVDEYLEMRKEAGVMDLFRGAKQGLLGGVDPARAVADAKESLKGATTAFGALGKKGYSGPGVRELLANYNAAHAGAQVGPAHDALTQGYSLGQKMQAPLAIGAGVLALGGTVYAIRKIHGAMTKQRDFKAMMELNPHLADAHAARPELFNQAYSSLRKMNPALTADPLVAGTFMNKMMMLDTSPGQQGGILAEVAGMATPQQTGLGLRKFGPLEMR